MDSLDICLELVSRATISLPSHRPSQRRVLQRRQNDWLPEMRSRIAKLLGVILCAG